MLTQSMGLTNDSLIETVFEKHPEKEMLPEQGDEIFVNWNFQDFQDGGYLNFKADRSDLFALSIMIENYASKHTAPLLASFETDKRYEFVKDRYLKLMKKLQEHGLLETSTIHTWLKRHLTVVWCLVV